LRGNIDDFHGNEKNLQKQKNSNMHRKPAGSPVAAHLFEGMDQVRQMGKKPEQQKSTDECPPVDFLL
jgi:hypothetical protein